MRTAYNVGDIILVPMQVDSINVYSTKIVYSCTRIRKPNSSLHLVVEDEIKGKVDIEQETIGEKEEGT